MNLSSITFSKSFSKSSSFLSIIFMDSLLSLETAALVCLAKLAWGLVETRESDFAFKWLDWSSWSKYYSFSLLAKSNFAYFSASYLALFFKSYSSFNFSSLAWINYSLSFYFLALFKAASVSLLMTSSIFYLLLSSLMAFFSSAISYLLDKPSLYFTSAKLLVNLARSFSLSDLWGCYLNLLNK